MKKIMPMLFSGLLVFSYVPSLFAHEHKPPHNGTLIVLGEEFAHVEMVLDPDQGVLTAYILDGEAENPVRINQDSFSIEGKIPVTFHAVNNPLTGEVIGNTSEFSAQSNLFKRVKKFQGAIDDLTVKGQHFKNVEFLFPEGNETEEKNEEAKK